MTVITRPWDIEIASVGMINQLSINLSEKLFKFGYHNPPYKEDTGVQENNNVNENNEDVNEEDDEFGKKVMLMIYYRILID